MWTPSAHLFEFDGVLVHEGILAILLHELRQAGLHVPRARQAAHRGLERFLPRFDVFPARVRLDDGRPEPRVLVEKFANVQALHNAIHCTKTSEES